MSFSFPPQPVLEQPKPPERFHRKEVQAVRRPDTSYGPLAGGVLRQAGAVSFTADARPAAGDPCEYRNPWTEYTVRAENRVDPWPIDTAES